MKTLLHDVNEYSPNPAISPLMTPSPIEKESNDVPNEEEKPKKILMSKDEAEKIIYRNVRAWHTRVKFRGILYIFFHNSSRIL